MNATRNPFSESVVAMKTQRFTDDRGFLIEAFNKRRFVEATGFTGEFVQDNQSRSRLGVLRGLHYQVEPHAQGKLVRAVTGVVFDVAVDIRSSSRTFGNWFGTELSAEKGNQIWIPPGFAHGFLALTDGAELLYRVTDYHSPDHERSIRWDDPAIGITWPIGGVGEIHLSERDKNAMLLKDADVFA
jgi:dTDP-4-dehydrorhamnose 3,5-epimerase